MNANNTATDIKDIAVAQHLQNLRDKLDIAFDMPCYCHDPEKEDPSECGSCNDVIDLLTEIKSITHPEDSFVC